MYLLFVLALLFVSQATAWVYRGAFDTSEDVSGSEVIKCLFTRYDVGMFRVITNGSVDNVGWQNYRAARNVMPDFYLELIAELNGNVSVEDQFTTFWNNIGHDIRWPSLWIDLTGSVNNWGTNKTKNYEFIKTFLGKATDKGFAVGVFVKNKSTDVIGNQTLESHVRVWYQGNVDTDMSDYIPFGGQLRPSVKQYNSKFNDCNVTINQNIYDAPYKKAIELKPRFDKKLLVRKNNHH